MHRSQLNKVKDQFKEQMERSFQLIRSASKQTSSFSQDQIYLIYELSFLRIFLAWEWFVENTFILYMSGIKTGKGYRAKTYVKPRNEKHAYDLVREGRDYVDWTSTDTVIRKASLFFEKGAPYKNALEQVITDIQDMKTLRNATVHMSKDSQEKFKSLVRRKIGYAKTNITPGEFLYTPVKNKALTYITYFGNRLRFVGEKIVE